MLMGIPIRPRFETSHRLVRRTVRMWNKERHHILHMEVSAQSQHIRDEIRIVFPQQKKPLIPAVEHFIDSRPYRAETVHVIGRVVLAIQGRPRRRIPT